MSHFVGELQQNLSRYDHETCSEVALCEVPFQKLQPITQRLLEGFSRITTLRIEGCDLRTLENFPALKTLTHAHLANNKLQGSFQHLLPLTSLKYLDVSKNLLVTAAVCYPLRNFRNLTVRVAENPFVSREEDWKELLKSYKLAVEEKQELHAQANEGWSRRGDSDIEQRRLRYVKRNDTEDRDRTYQRTLENLISMVQMTNSAIEAEISLPKREGSIRAPRRPIGDAHEPEQSALRSGRSYFSNFHYSLMSPRSREQPLLVDSGDFMEDSGIVDDGYEMASDQY